MKLLAKMKILQLYLGLLFIVYSVADDIPTEDLDEINSKIIPRGQHYGDHLSHMDIMMSPDDEKRYFDETDEETGIAKAAINQRQLLWTIPIPYEITGNNGLYWQGTIPIENAMRELSEKTCIYFRKKVASDIDYLSFVQNSGCWSYVGKKGGRQEISLGDGCYNKRIAVHEIMHALGFLHEQSRPDRDSFVEIKYENILPGQEDQFKKAKSSFTHDLNVPYDYISVMHYGRKAFSKNNLDTIIVPNKPSQQLGQTGSNGGLTTSDIEQINRLYQCGARCTPNCKYGRCVSPTLCICNPGWKGLLCSEPICNQSCINGQCVSPNECSCYSGWEGKDCSTEEQHFHCFPPDAYARNENGFKIQMKDLKVGEKVLTMDKKGKLIFSEIIMMLHRNENTMVSDYVSISTKEGWNVTLSSHHLIPVSNSGFTFSKDVYVNQNVTTYDALKNHVKSSQVKSIKYVTKKGVYAPLTMEGTIMVNDVLTSCYASFPSHAISHAVFSLWRFLYQRVYSSLLSKLVTDDGIHWYPTVVQYAANYAGLLSF